MTSQAKQVKQATAQTKQVTSKEKAKNKLKTIQKQANNNNNVNNNKNNNNNVIFVFSQKITNSLNKQETEKQKKEVCTLQTKFVYLQIIN